MRSTLALAFLLTTTAAFAQDKKQEPEKVENPAYKNWAKFKPGTTVTWKRVNAVGKVAVESGQTTTLVEVTADKLIVNEVSTRKAGDKVVTYPPRRIEVARMIPLPGGGKKELFTAGIPEETKQQGTEVLKVAGREIKMTWYEIEIKHDPILASAKVWLSDDVPGRVVKEVLTPRPPTTGNETRELVEVKTP